MSFPHRVTVRVAVQKEGKFLLALRHAKDTYMPGRWNFPGGKVEYTEKDEAHILEEEANREIKEETGIEIQNLKVIGNFTYRVGGKHTIGVLFVADWKSGEAGALEDTEEVRWVSPEEFKNYKLVPNFKKNLNWIYPRLKEQSHDPRLHFVVATGIVVKDGKFLIVKRAPNEKAFPSKWSVPGGKLVLSEYQNLPKTSPSHPQWYGVVDWVLRKEVREETGIEIDSPQYLCDLVFVRPDGFPVVTLSYWARYKSGEVRLDKSHTDFAWVTLREAKSYDLIDGIWKELEDVDKLSRNAPVFMGTLNKKSYN